MDIIKDFFTNIESPTVISIIGLAKNVSKTTTLNYIIRNIGENYVLGLTSIGRDGEKYDVITNLPKPQIYVKKGTYVVTAKQCLEDSKIEFEVIKNTGYNTPLGEVMILKAQGDGYIELAGPSINKQLSKICVELKNLGCDLVLVDGAFDRKSYATPLISDATIISTGASVSSNMSDVVDLTIHTINLLNSEQEMNEETINLSKEIMIKSKIGIINRTHSIKFLNVTTALDSAQDIIENLDEDSNYVVINGAITDKLLEDLMRSTQKYKGITFLVADGTKLFLSNNMIKKFQKKGGIIKVLKSINIIAVTINPTSPNGYEFNKNKFLKSLTEELTIPVYNLGVND
ncbi:hypothetical protein LCGC14_1045690 [marine sediment metagenome]|uniref:Uncharacterized protein n=1 Tax=marine sediment metagenome TaxID=412755 RepID=A0A0F9NC54_9ZZZZ